MAILTTLILGVSLAVVQGSVVARIGDVAITHEMIACEDETMAACHAIEQRKLNRLFITTFVSLAAKYYEISITDDDIERSGRVPKDAVIAEVAARQRKIIEAVKRIHHGEEAHAVYEHSLRPAGIAWTELEQYRSFFKNDTRVDAALSQDIEAGYRREIRNSVRQLLTLNRLHDRLSHEASAHGQTHEEAELAMMRELTRTLHPAIIDQTFKEPELKGVLSGQNVVVRQQ
jgi:hypothetical protein